MQKYKKIWTHEGPRKKERDIWTHEGSIIYMKNNDEHMKAHIK
jgi:hypothetical protein